MTPGFYVMLVFGMPFVSIGPDWQSVERLRTIAKTLTQYWPLTIVILFSSYLLGSILRVYPVNPADRMAAFLFARFARNRWTRLVYEANFRYRPMLDATLEALTKNGMGLDETLPPDGTSHTMFDVWKLRLCEEGRAGFAAIQILV